MSLTFLKTEIYVKVFVKRKFTWELRCVTLGIPIYEFITVV